jgi:hypothetical protein
MGGKILGEASVIAALLYGEGIRAAKIKVAHGFFRTCAVSAIILVALVVPLGTTYARSVSNETFSKPNIVRVSQAQQRFAPEVIRALQGYSRINALRLCNNQEALSRSWSDLR